MFFHFCHFPIFIFSVHNSVQWWSLIIYLSKRARAAWIEILSQNIAWTGALLSQILWHDRMLVGILILIVKGNALTNFQLQRPTLELLKETLGSFLNGLNLTVNWAPIKSIVYDHILSFIICIMSWEIFTPFFLYIIQSLLWPSHMYVCTDCTQSRAELILSSAQTYLLILIEGLLKLKWS